MVTSTISLFFQILFYTVVHIYIQQECCADDTLH